LEFSPGLVFRNQTILGLSNGHLHSFRNFGIGGIGSVSAFPYKTKSGDHMIQTNVELIMTPDFTDENMFFKVFFDSGLAFDSDKMVDIKKISDRKNDFISAVGIGIGTESEDGLGVGFNLAKPLNDSDYLETTIRLHFNF
jgi:hemolysin activation/secretion protein